MGVHGCGAWVCTALVHGRAPARGLHDGELTFKACTRLDEHLPFVGAVPGGYFDLPCAGGEGGNDDDEFGRVAGDRDCCTTPVAYRLSV